MCESGCLAFKKRCTDIDWEGPDGVDQQRAAAFSFSCLRPRFSCPDPDEGNIDAKATVQLEAAVREMLRRFS